MRHQWREKFWGRRYNHAPVKDTEAAQVKRFRYILSNGCKEGLVASPLDWPGVTSARALYNGESELEGRWFDRTAQYRAGATRGDRQYSSIETVKLSPLPFLADYSPASQRQFMIDSVREVEREVAKQGTRTMDARLIRSVNPHSAPKNFKPSPAPALSHHDAGGISRAARDPPAEADRVSRRGGEAASRGARRRLSAG